MLLLLRVCWMFVINNCLLEQRCGFSYFACCCVYLQEGNNKTFYDLNIKYLVFVMYSNENRSKKGMQFNFHLCRLTFFGFRIVTT